jgi:hypothetical protein
MTDAIELPEDCHPKIRKIFDYWRYIHPPSGLPSRQHLDPVDIPDLLPHIRLIDIVGDPPRFRVRLCGDRVRDYFGCPQHGRYFDEMFPSFTSRASYFAFMNAIVTHEPSWDAGACDLNPAKVFVPMERIVLPLAGDGRRVDMLILVSLFGEDARRDAIPPREAAQSRRR